jgi:hypothetical protein
MSKETRKFFEQLKDSKIGQGFARFFDEVGAELKQQAAHGAHELAAALFAGNAFVMYPRQQEQREDPQHGLPPEAQKEQERSRGMEM